MSHEYEGVRRVVLGGDDEYSGATFIPVCPRCGRFVRAFRRIKIKMATGQPVGNNARCKGCGPVPMIFEGYP